METQTVKELFTYDQDWKNYNYMILDGHVIAICGTGDTCRVSGIGWLTGAVLLVGSLALLLFGLPLANIWVKLAAYIGVPVMMLSWAGCLIVFRRLRMSAAACAQEKGKVLLP